MKIYRISTRSHPILDKLEEAIKYTLENAHLNVEKKSQLMAGGNLKEYGVLELTGKNVKFNNDSIRIKVFFEIWNSKDSDNNWGEKKPQNIPLYRGFVDGERPTPWDKSEEVGTYKDLYGPSLSQLIDPKYQGMNRLDEFEYVVGNPIDVANIIKSIIDKWGDDNDFNVNDLEPIPVSPKEKLVKV